MHTTYTNKFSFCATFKIKIWTLKKILEDNCFTILDWCWSWNSDILATWCEELTHWKRPWCWERLKAWGAGNGRGWDGWMASLTQWTRVWVGSRSWWWTGRPGVLQSMGSERVGQDWATELNFFLRLYEPDRPLPLPWTRGVSSPPPLLTFNVG